MEGRAIMKGNNYLAQMEKMAPALLIDPINDLGKFDSRSLQFEEPVSELKNKMTGKPFNEHWYQTIEEMRKIYIKWQMEIQSNFEEGTEKKPYTKRNSSKKKEKDQQVKWLLSLGFSFKTVGNIMRYSEKTLKNKGYHQSDYYVRSPRPTLLKSDLRHGIVQKKETLLIEEIGDDELFIAIKR